MPRARLRAGLPPQYAAGFADVMAGPGEEHTARELRRAQARVLRAALEPGEWDSEEWDGKVYTVVAHIAAGTSTIRVGSFPARSSRVMDLVTNAPS